MSSSTSSSDREVWALALALSALLAGELAVRLIGDRLSINVRHIREIPRIVASLEEGEGLRVIVLGNSLVREAIVPDRIREALRVRRRGPVRLARIMPDDTTMAEWPWILKRFVLDGRVRPDWLVLGFAQDQLEDGTTLHPERLGGFYCRLRDVPDVFSSEVVRFEDRAEFLVASFSEAFTSRRRISRRILDLLIPDYRDTARRLNRTLQPEAAGSMARARPTYRRLAHLARLAASRGVRVVVVAMPVRDGYAICPDLPATVDRLGMRWLDAREITDLAPEAFRDPLHLRSAAAERYSRALGERLADLILE